MVYLERPHLVGVGIQRLYRFENGYGASVVRFSFGNEYGSYTSNSEEWEVAVVVLKGEGFDIELTYDTPIANDVIGHVTNEALPALLAKIEALPAIKNQSL